MAQPVILPNRTFATKKNATEFFRSMLGRYLDGQEINQTDSRLLFELLQRHPEAHDKIGTSGVRRFYRDKTEVYTSCFFLERNDGSRTDFSVLTCISGKAPSVEQQFYQACRTSVAEDLAARKDELFLAAGGTLHCAKTGAPVTCGESEYRHTTPRFQEIVEMFIKKKGINIDVVEFSQGSDMQYLTSFTDPSLAESFKLFHARHAQLAIFKKYERHNPDGR